MKIKAAFRPYMYCDLKARKGRLLFGVLSVLSVVMTKLLDVKCLHYALRFPKPLDKCLKNRPIRPANSERFLHKPVISDELKNTTAKEGEIVTLACRVTSELHPHFVWIKHYQVNGSWEDEEKKPYYRRIYPTQVSIRTTIAQGLAECLPKYLNCLSLFSFSLLPLHLRGKQSIPFARLFGIKKKN
jgi:hypothetical protein